MRFLIRSLVLLVCAGLPMQAAAFDSSRFPSPTFANPKLNKIFVQGGGSVAAETIYRAAYPNVQFDDTAQHILDVPAGATQENLAGVASYVRTSSGNAQNNGAAGNAVGFFSAGNIIANNSALWTINGLITDNSTRAPLNGGSGRIAVGAEFDFNIMSATTQVIGVSVGGNSLVQPTNANAFMANSLGTGMRWNAGFWSLDGASQYAMIAGTQAASGTNVASQPILLQYLDVVGAKQSTQFQAGGGFVTLSGAPNGFSVAAGDVLVQSGRSFVVNGQPVVGARKGGWTSGTGTPYRGTFNADYTQTIGATYSQTQVQALQDALLQLQRRVLALETDNRAHGLIGN